MKEDLKIEQIDFSKEELEEEYINYIFINCDFTQIKMGSTYFEDCSFVSCNFSLTKINNTNFHNVKFIECKLTGTDFSKSNPFSSFYFEKSNLQYSNLSGMKLKGTKFIQCDLQESNIENSNLTSSIFKECNLLRTFFNKTNLEKSDLSTSYNFIIDPQQNNLKNAIFSKQNLEGLLLAFGIKIID